LKQFISQLFTHYFNRGNYLIYLVLLVIGGQAAPF